MIIYDSGISSIHRLAGAQAKDQVDCFSQVVAHGSRGWADGALVSLPVLPCRKKDA